MTKGLKVGIVQFPCSNGDYDSFKFFQIHGHCPEFISHKKSKVNSKYDLLVLPGGFAFGDRVYEKATGAYNIDPGVMALQSPVMETIHEYAENDTPILGICNGFQILTEAGLLPGKLERNKDKKFYSNFVKCQVTGQGFFNDRTLIGKVISIPIAHYHGKYEISKEEYKKLKQNKQIFLEYLPSNNPNGSYKNIAGVCNEKGTIFGLMPHPERIPKKRFFISSIENAI